MNIMLANQSTNTFSNSPNTQHLLSQQFSTPIGNMLVAATNAGICLLQFVNKQGINQELKRMAHTLKLPQCTGVNHHIQETIEQLHQYFNGQRQTFRLQLNPIGTDFQKKVWQALAKIPYGETISYQAQATSINKPTAVRAVAAANGANHISIVLPCHRVIGKNGTLTGYASGVDKKCWLLEHEQRH